MQCMSAHGAAFPYHDLSYCVDLLISISTQFCVHRLRESHVAGRQITYPFVTRRRSVDGDASISKCCNTHSLSSMGSKLSRSIASYRSRNDRRVLLIGLEGAGKSAILSHIRKLTGKSMSLGEITQTFDVQDLRVGKFNFSVWDVGGKEALRPYWRHHYVGTQGVVFVVDATDRVSLPTAIAELRSAATDLQLQDAAFLICANKCDQRGALTALELSQAMDLSSVMLGHPWHVQATSALKGEGLEQGWKFLAENMKEL